MLGIIPRAQAKTPTWVKSFLIISLIFLGGSILSLFALNWAQGSARRSIAQTQQEIVNLSTPQNKSLEKTVKVAQKQISGFAGVLKDHIKPSAFFNLLKANTHPGVVLTEFSLKADKAQVKLKGRAQSFQAVGEQILVLQKQSKIRSVSLSDLSLDKNYKIHFTLDLALDPQLLK